MSRTAKEVPWLETRGGTYYVFWYNKETRRTERVSLRTKAADEAKDRYAAFLQEGSDVYRRHDGLDVGSILSDYEREHVHGVVVRNGRTEPRMVAKHRTLVCIGHLRRHLGADQVASLGVTACEKYQADRRKDPPRPVSDPTIRRELSILAAAINHATKRKRVVFNTKDLWLPPASNPRDRWLTYAELDHLRTVAARESQVVADFVEVAYYTASRARAVETLSLFQVDLPRGQIALGKPDEVRTKKRRPTVPIDEELRPTVERLLSEAIADGRTYLLPPVGRRSDRRILETFKRVARAAGLEGVTPHVLRHSRATHLLQRGASIWEVAKLLGDTVATVDRVYGHHCTDAVAHALRSARRDR